VSAGCRSADLTLPTTCASRQTSRLDMIYVQPRHHLWLCAVRGCLRTATELSWSPPRESGTVCHVTSRLLSHCLFFLQSSEDSSLQKQFSFTILLCPRSDTRHYGYINRCSYLLTDFDHSLWFSFQDPAERRVTRDKKRGWK